MKILYCVYGFVRDTVFRRIDNKHVIICVPNIVNEFSKQNVQIDKSVCEDLHTYNYDIFKYINETRHLVRKGKIHNLYSFRIYSYLDMLEYVSNYIRTCISEVERNNHEFDMIIMCRADHFYDKFNLRKIPNITNKLLCLRGEMEVEDMCFILNRNQLNIFDGIGKYFLTNRFQEQDMFPERILYLYLTQLCRYELAYISEYIEIPIKINAVKYTPEFERIVNSHYIL